MQKVQHMGSGTRAKLKGVCVLFLEGNAPIGCNEVMLCNTNVLLPVSTINICNRIMATMSGGPRGN